MPFPPGGGTDLLARELADQLSRKFPQPFVVENKPGAGAAVGTEYVARAHGWPYVPVHLLEPCHRAGAEHEAALRHRKDFKSIVLVADQASVLSVDPDLPGANLQEVIAYIKRTPANSTTAQPASAPANT